MCCTVLGIDEETMMCVSLKRAGHHKLYSIIGYHENELHSFST